MRKAQPWASAPKGPRRQRPYEVDSLARLDSEPVAQSKISGSTQIHLKRFAMERFIHQQNLLLYRKLLSETTDEEKRQTLFKLLADEKAKDNHPQSSRLPTIPLETDQQGPAHAK
jgi:hypothetical protein